MTILLHLPKCTYVEFNTPTYTLIPENAIYATYEYNYVKLEAPTKSWYLNNATMDLTLSMPPHPPPPPT